MMLRQDRYQPHTPPYLLYALLGSSLLLNLYMVFSRPADGGDPEAVVEALSPEPVVGEPTLQDRVAQAEVVSASAVEGSSEWKMLRGEIQQSLGHTFQSKLEKGADTMTQVFGRLFMWDMNLRRDVMKGDEVAVLWRPTEDGLLEIGATWYASTKKGETLKIYRYQAPGERYASYWYPDGTEVPLRLVDSPIDEYDQITSLFRDGRKDHQGMDFKTDTGTAVISPKPGTVTRVNWNVGSNGNCIEVRYPDGMLAKFLHLEEVMVSAGQHVKSGEVIAKSGNTGHSTAPHLHYQVDKGKESVDPLDYHGTIRRKLDDAAMKDFQKEIERLDRLMGALDPEG